MMKHYTYMHDFACIERERLRRLDVGDIESHIQATTTNIKNRHIKQGSTCKTTLNV